MKPKYNFGDSITFSLKDGTYTGIVHQIDLGTFANPNEVCYDVLVKENNKEILFKHVPEHLVVC